MYQGCVKSSEQCLAPSRYCASISYYYHFSVHSSSLFPSSPLSSNLVCTHSHKVSIISFNLSRLTTVSSLNFSSVLGLPPVRRNPTHSKWEVVILVMSLNCNSYLPKKWSNFCYLSSQIWRQRQCPGFLYVSQGLSPVVPAH